MYLESEASAVVVVVNRLYQLPEHNWRNKNETVGKIASGNESCWCSGFCLFETKTSQTHG